MKKIGYTEDLFVLPFDHRGSFQSKLFGIKGRDPTPEETAHIASYKDIIYDGFKRALKDGVPQAKAGILVDEQFGTAIHLDARKNRYKTACPAEKSGQDEFDFEYGEEFGSHIAKLDPTFVKVLVRHNVEGDLVSNRRQAERLKRLSEYCHANNRFYMFELLVPATPEQLAKAGGSQAKFDSEMRPDLMVRAIHELQKAGVEPDIWKIEGLETAEQCRKVAEATREGAHRKEVGCILLGRGENGEKVKHWLATAANVPGFVGFAVGRTIFWEPLVAVKEGKISKEAAAEQIADTYRSFCDLWVKARKH